MQNKKPKKIEWKRLLKKAFEDGIKKAIELSIIAIIVGAALKIIMITVPAVTFGSVIAKIIKIKFMD